MALHWEHVKGFYGSAANNTLYTYIEYKSGPTGTLYAEEQYLPDVWLSKTNINGSPTAGVYCGHLMATNITNTAHRSLVFDNPSDYEGIILRNNVRIAFDAYGTQSTSTTGADCYFERQSNGFYFYSLTATTFDIADGNDRPGSFIFGNGSSATTDVYVYGNLGTSQQLSAQKGVFTQECQALYFNATSDIRAKENLQPIPSNMLDIVKQMEVYTFNYKINPEDMSLGLIAQDLQNININGFSLVDNLNATGENDDYMSIHESKLVYILIEAVKELSAKVESLERELHGSK